MVMNDTDSTGRLHFIGPAEYGGNRRERKIWIAVVITIVIVLTILILCPFLIAKRKDLKIIESLSSAIRKLRNETNTKLANKNSTINGLELEIQMLDKLLKQTRDCNSFESIKTNDTGPTKISKALCANVTRSQAKTWNGTGGVFDIYAGATKLEAYCDLTTDGGGWIVFQRRMDGSVNFQRKWDDYVNGFGEKDKEFWFGLENIYQIMLMTRGIYELRVDLKDWENNNAFAQYRRFMLEGKSSHYRIAICRYSGTAGDALDYHNRMQFTTMDKDNDKSTNNCAQLHSGGWWYHACDHADLNGVYKHSGKYTPKRYDDGIEWNKWKNITYYSMKFTEMKFRMIDN